MKLLIVEDEPSLREIMVQTLRREQYVVEQAADYASGLDKIAALGGKPTTQPAPVPEAATPRAMLEAVLQAEKETIARYVERMKQAEAYGDYDLANDLQEIISEETRHKEETEKLLKGTWQE